VTPGAVMGNVASEPGTESMRTIRSGSVHLFRKENHRPV
jgi:hypothetical protein